MGGIGGMAGTLLGGLGSGAIGAGTKLGDTLAGKEYEGFSIFS